MKETIIYVVYVNSFSCLTACYLVRLNEQFFGRNQPIWGAKMAQPPPEKLARVPMLHTWCLLVRRYFVILISQIYISNFYSASTVSHIQDLPRRWTIVSAQVFNGIWGQSPPKAGSKREPLVGSALPPDGESFLSIFYKKRGAKS